MSGYPAFLLSLLALLQAVPPHEDAGGTDVIADLSVRRDTCNLGVAKKVDLLALANDPQKWSGECVAVEGYWRDHVLFVSASDARGRDSEIGARLSTRRIGLYGTANLPIATPRRAKAVTAVGMAGRCETLGGGAVMVFGYCHYTGGPYIALAEMLRR